MAFLQCSTQPLIFEEYLLNAIQPETNDTVDERGRNDRDRDVVLSARDVTVAFGRKVVLDKLNLDI